MDKKINSLDEKKSEWVKWCGVCKCANYLTPLEKNQVGITKVR